MSGSLSTKNRRATAIDCTSTGQGDYLVFTWSPALNHPVVYILRSNKRTWAKERSDLARVWSEDPEVTWKDISRTFRFGDLPLEAKVGLLAAITLDYRMHSWSEVEATLSKGVDKGSKVEGRLVRKADGNMVYDYRGLNDCIEKDKFPLPKMQEILDRLKGAKYFTVMDGVEGYHQMKLDPDGDGVPVDALGGLMKARMMRSNQDLRRNLSSWTPRGVLRWGTRLAR